MNEQIYANLTLFNNGSGRNYYNETNDNKLQNAYSQHSREKCYGT